MSYEYMSGFGLGDAAADAQAFKTNQYRLRSEAFKKFGKAVSSIGDPCTPPEGGFIRKVHANIPKTPEEIPVVESQMAPILAAGCKPTGRMWDIYKAEMCCPLDTPKITYLFPLPPNFQPPAAPEVVVEPPAVAQTASPVAPVVLSPGAEGHVEAFLPPTAPAAPAAPPALIAPEEAEPGSEVPPEEMLPEEPAFEPEAPIVEPPVTNGSGAQVTNGATTANGNGAAVAADETLYFGLTQTQLIIAGVGGAAAIYFLFIRK